METRRTIFLKPAATEYDEIFALESNEQSRAYLGGPVAKEKFPEKFRAMLSVQPPECYWVVRHKGTNAFIGLVCITNYHDRIHYDVSYQLHPAFWGEGYGTEIIRKVIEYGLSILGLEELYAETQKKNLASVRVLEKVGMQFVSQIERFGEEQVVYSIRNSGK